MDWSAQQKEALAAAEKWIKTEGGPQVFYLAGYAGTGKTTLAKELAKEIDGDACFAAFTGKAAQVMRNKGCDGAQTIHGLIYRLKESDEAGKPTFEIKRDGELRHAKAAIIDEVSMVNEEIGRDLLSFGKKVLVIGDPAQLPPVKGAGYFTERTPDFMLTEVHRQARDNPIIALSMRIREGEKIDHFNAGDLQVCGREHIESEDVLEADQVIVGINKTRVLYNRRMRELKNLPLNVPVIGDKVICLKNDHKLGIFNGSMWQISRVRKHKKNPTYLAVVRSIDDPDAAPRSVEIREEFFNGTEADVDWREKKGTQEFTFGYAITCHKSQGSQFDNVLVFDESAAFREDSRRWLYTATTRAVNRLTIVI